MGVADRRRRDGLIVAATLGAVGAACFAAGTTERLTFRGASALAVALGVLAALHVGWERDRRSLLEITDAMRNPSSSFYTVRWNSFSRVVVGGNPFVKQVPPGWGLSDKTDALKQRVRLLMISIDSSAATPITNFDGDTKKHFYLKDDVTNMVHHIRHGADVAVVGVGGGRDILSSLVFDQKSVLGIELNANVLRTITEDFADFSGRLGENPKVRLVNDEARSYLTRLNARFDVLQLSLIDTFAATAAGALVLSENTLYTTDAWTTFLEHLKPHGVLTVSRWYYTKRPAEALRVASLARASLARIGVMDPRPNVIIVLAPHANGLAGVIGNGVVNVLVSRDPFSAEDVATIDRETRRLGFEVVISPTESNDPSFEQMLSEKADRFDCIVSARLVTADGRQTVLLPHAQAHRHQRHAGEELGRSESWTDQGSAAPPVSARRRRCAHPGVPGRPARANDRSPRVARKCFAALLLFRHRARVHVHRDVVDAAPAS